MSWCQTTGGLFTYGFCQESQGNCVWDLPTTNPQLIRPTLYFTPSGSDVSKIEPAPRAMYSVTTIGRP